MSSWARPGVKCVCVDDNWSKRQREVTPNLPELGKTYTIRDVITASVKGPLLLLEEIENPLHVWKQGLYEVPFPYNRFRPLITRTQEQDMAIFTPLLTTTPVREPV